MSNVGFVKEMLEGFIFMIEDFYCFLNFLEVCIILVMVEGNFFILKFEEIIVYDY